MRGDILYKSWIRDGMNSLRRLDPRNRVSLGGCLAEYDLVPNEEGGGGSCGERKYVGRQILGKFEPHSVQSQQCPPDNHYP